MSSSWGSALLGGEDEREQQLVHLPHGRERVALDLWRQVRAVDVEVMLLSVEQRLAMVDPRVVLPREADHGGDDPDREPVGVLPEDLDAPVGTGPVQQPPGDRSQEHLTPLLNERLAEAANEPPVVAPMLITVQQQPAALTTGHRVQHRVRHVGDGVPDELLVLAHDLAQRVVGRHQPGVHAVVPDNASLLTRTVVEAIRVGVQRRYEARPDQAVRRRWHGLPYYRRRVSISTNRSAQLGCSSYDQTARLATVIDRRSVG